MCSALKCIGRCLQGRPGVCGNLQAVKTAHLSSCPPASCPPVLLSSCLLSSCPPVLLSSCPPAQHVAVACKPLLAHFGASTGVCARNSSRAEGPGKTSRAGDNAKGVRAKFRYGVARSGQRVFLNFDLTPFASRDPICVSLSDPFCLHPGSASEVMVASPSDGAICSV